MSNESMMSVLEQIRDQQKQQIDNFERALETQQEAMTIQRSGRRTLVAMIAMPWVLVLVLLGLLILGGFSLS